ncbi:GNAT family N-acetyltransferase [Planctomonas psychrotolerans]|uniref:GNAT family N-acetyltransferase n=1 Tax=Planctomonas psychrotolerans TaxID=2528712 RepID=UPI001D0D68BC|nr:GNAT family N-acetyltransferase [Planctomonas psychrotolerans]
MQPFPLRTERFILDQPSVDDVDDIASYCSDPVFEMFVVTPWPYERQHAEYFVNEHVPGGWAQDDEWTWAIRDGSGQPLLGVICIRVDSGMVGFWLGAPHRGRGIMPEALTAVIDATFDRTERTDVLWECVVGNHASLRVAEKVGYRYTGQRDGMTLGRDGASTPSWTGRLGRDDTRAPQPGWPRG